MSDSNRLPPLDGGSAQGPGAAGSSDRDESLGTEPRSVRASLRFPRLRRALKQLKDEERTRFESVVRGHLSPVRQFVVRELDHLRAAGLVEPDCPSGTEVLDDALVRALEDLPFRSEVLPVATWLIRHAARALDHEVALARASARESLSAAALARLRRLSQPAAVDEPPDPVERADIETVNIANIAAAGPSTDPATGLAREEVRRAILDALTDLPSQWRRAVILAELDEQPLSAVALTLEADVDSVAAMLDHANAFLRARLVEEDIEWPDSGSTADLIGLSITPSGTMAELEPELVRLLAVENVDI